MRNAQRDVEPADFYAKALNPTLALTDALRRRTLFVS